MLVVTNGQDSGNDNDQAIVDLLEGTGVTSSVETFELMAA